MSAGLQEMLIDGTICLKTMQLLYQRTDDFPTVGMYFGPALLYTLLDLHLFVISMNSERDNSNGECNNLTV